MLMKNTSGVTITLGQLGGLKVPAGGLVEIADGYCVPRPSTTGVPPTESAIRLMAPQLMPADEDKHAAYLANELVVDVQPAPPSMHDLQERGLSPGQAALVMAGQAGTVVPTKRAPKAPQE